MIGRAPLLAGFAALAASLSLVALPARSGPAPDPGQRLWLQCRACHTIKAGEPDKVGPNLHRLLGAKAASLRPAYAYSPALKASGIVWSEARLDAFLTKPAAVVPGNRMAFAGIADPVQRKALITWLKREAN